MADMKKVVKGLEMCIRHGENAEVGCGRKNECPYEQVGLRCWLDLNRDALALLKKQETTSTGKTRIFQCEKCGYGIDDIYLSNEHDFDVYPHYCPHCGRKVKWE